MSKFVRKTVVAAKLEVTPGTDIVPGAGDCILVRNPVITPLEMTTAERNIVRGFFGNFDAITTLRKVKIAFEVELQGSGLFGSAPAWDPLMQASGALQALTPPATPVNSAFGTATTGGTLAAATYFYRVSAIYGGGESLASAETSQITTGATSTVTVNWGAVANALGYKIYGRTTGAELFLAQVPANVLTFIDTGALTPAGALPSAASGGVGYSPLSGTGKTVSMYYNVDGTLHKMVWARGNCKLKIKANDIPVFAFEFIGLDTGATDVAILTPTSFSSYKTPLAANKANTPTFSLFGVSTLALENFELDFGNVNQQISRIGSEQILHTDRKSVGTIMIEMTSIATKDWLSQVKNNTLGAVNLVHGTVAGSIISVASPNVELQTPQFSDIQGIQMAQFATRYNPSTAGNDEWTIANT
jgi:hypothetical protein